MTESSSTLGGGVGKTETAAPGSAPVCDYCDNACVMFQCGGKFKTCETHILRPFQEEQAKEEEEVKETCPECGEQEECYDYSEEIDYEQWTWAQNVKGAEEECECKCGRWFSTVMPMCPICCAKEFKWTEAMMLKAGMVPLED